MILKIENPTSEHAITDADFKTTTTTKGEGGGMKKGCETYNQVPLNWTETQIPVSQEETERPSALELMLHWWATLVVAHRYTMEVKVMR